MEKQRNGSLVLCIGGIPVLILSESYEFMAQTEKRYANFVTTDVTPVFKIQVNILSERTVPDLTTYVEKPEVTFVNGTEHGTFAWQDLSGKFDFAMREARMSCSLNPAGLNSFLRFIFSVILLKEQGFLVHASGLIKNGVGYIFPGKSGAGKTTITQLSQDATLLSDDLPIVKLGDNPVIFGTPFWGGLAVAGEKTSAPLAGIYFPIKDKENYVERLTPKKTFEKLLPNAVFFFKNEEFSKQLFKLCFDFSTKVAGYELHFLLDPSFWECIDVR
jgi:hypothetical protein